MKKIVILFILGIMMISFPLFAQPKCGTDVWMTLSNKQIPKAIKIADVCVEENSNSADAWLMRANAYLQRHQEEEIAKEKNPNYVIKHPDAIIIANESFMKAQEINPKVEPKQGMIGPEKGRSLCALPLYYKAKDAFDAKNYEKARDLFNISIKNFNLERNPNPQLKYNLGIFYLQLAKTYIELKDSANAKQTIINGTRTNTSYPDIYLQLYDIYKEEGDTTNALKTLQTAKKNVVETDTLALLDIYTAELDYYARMKNLEKMNNVRDLIFEKFGKTVSTISLIVAYLNNSDQLESAEELLLEGLEMAPLNFDLNYRMGQRYYLEGLRYRDKADKATNEGKFSLLISLYAKVKEMFGKAHDWAEKTYQINDNDRENNILLNQLKAVLQKEIPEELKQKIEFYRSGN